MTTTRKTTIPSLLAATALAAVALAFAPYERAIAGNVAGMTGINGTSRDGIDPAAGCIIQSATEASPVIPLAALAAVALSLAPQSSERAMAGLFGSLGTNGTSLDGIEPAAGCIIQSAAEGNPVILLAGTGPNGTGGINGTSRDGIAPAAGCIVRSAIGSGIGLAR